MTQYLIVICVITILLWYYYIKSKEQDDKYLPVMIRQSELMHENTKLKQDNKKLKMRIKYLENYKNDVSKTFKILDNELGLINDHIKQRNTIPPNEQVNEQINEQTFRTSVTPTVLNSLLRTSQEPSYPSDGLFNNIFNRFLTGDMNFTQVPHQSPNNFESPQNSTTEAPQDLPLPQSSESTQEQLQDATNDSHENNENTAQVQSSVSFSVNYLPLNSNYRQYLIRRDGPEQRGNE
jgi:hypothetical protein